ncbi:hypothetical protein Q0590_34695 [Rhodocytophaga aerolata]|uniref:YD repeat-containing protein n=1 Tax=Rhodocytophaga aerolata TaxID=455078 RepID=A0ABT8RH97_9BACT|nr:hypothetical protein [Rhodocytophaga aerolata]MDO1451475.1 hypothetical protein [Rhodocytophaga aerolata]
MNKIYLVIICLLTISCQKDKEDILPKLIGKIKRFTYPANSNSEETFLYNSNLLLSDFKYIEQPLHYLRSCFYKAGRLTEIQFYEARRNDQEAKVLFLSKLYYFNGDDVLDSLHYVNVFDGRKVLTSRIFYKVNFNKQIVKSTLINDNYVAGVIHDTIYSEYGYNSKGNIVSELSRSNSELGGRKGYSRVEYTYDDNPNPQQYLSLIFSEPTNPSYQATNNITKIVRYNQEGEITNESHYEYEYGADRKPIKEMWHSIL